MNELVRLKYATTQMFGVGGVPGGVAYTYVRVKVKNVAFVKDVQAHYRGPTGWLDGALAWQAHYGNYDVFGQNTAFVTEELVVRCSAAGQTEWDNNGGANYHLPSFRNIVGGNVTLSRATARRGTQAGGGLTFETSWLEGEIYVNNLSFPKRVGVRYSANGGGAWQDSDASYVGPVGEGTYATSAGAELWRFKTPELNLDSSAATFVFAVYYGQLDTGAWYWDNNFGQDYALAKADGAFIE